MIRALFIDGIKGIRDMIPAEINAAIAASAQLRYEIRKKVPFLTTLSMILVVRAIYFPPFSFQVYYIKYLRRVQTYIVLNTILPRQKT